MEYKKTYSFGKVNANWRKDGHKTNLIELDITLNVTDDKRVFTACGGVWNSSHTDYIQCGQCIDGIWKEFATEIQHPTLFKEIMRLWEKWHLNDMHAECSHQRLKGGFFVDSLKVGDKCKTCGYGYGEAWNYEEIAKNDLILICKLLDLDGQTINKIVNH